MKGDTVEHIDGNYNSTYGFIRYVDYNENRIHLAVVKNRKMKNFQTYIKTYGMITFTTRLVIFEKKMKYL